MKSKIAVPTLLLDRQKCQHNIQRMADKAGRLGLSLRPHFKTHQSSSIGRWFRQAGVDKITVSSLRMAEYFANDHWLDITVAFPVNLLEIDLINRLAAYIRLNLLVESVESVQFLDRHLRHPVGVFIKIDVGTHRTGVEADDEEAIDRILEKIGNARKVRFLGFLAHAGHTYRAQGIEEVRAIHETYLGLLATLCAHYRPTFPELILSVGDTPSCSLMEDFPGVQEIRPGNFVFYDVMQIGIGSCSPDDVAVAMACPVVATHPSRNEIVVYGGGIHFSKDRIALNGQAHYGLMVDWESDGWRLPDGEPAFLKSLSQEHGIVQASAEQVARTKPGDVLLFLPVHSCMTADLMKHYRTLDGEYIEMLKYI
jgi:D-serine deaminase-like pyridoxal phosphate-dependent protein